MPLVLADIQLKLLPEFYQHGLQQQQQHGMGFAAVLHFRHLVRAVISLSMATARSKF